MANSYIILRDKHKGQSCFIVGAGPSLYEVSRHPRYKKIFKHVSIFVNSSILAIKNNYAKKNRTYWISNDALVMRWTYWYDLKIANCTKIVRNSWSKYKEAIKGFLMFHPRPTSEGVIKPKDRGLAYCSSVPSALDLAIQMGCKKIFLIGVDHYMEGNKSHFWQFWSTSKWPKGPLAVQGQQMRSFQFNLQAFKALKGYAETKRVKIYNCNRLSRVKYFKKITFEEALDKADKTKGE